MSRFLEYATEILGTVEASLAAGQTPSNLTILVEARGGLRLVAESDWPLESLQAEHGARMAYRIRRASGRVVVEGRAGSSTCSLESEARLPRPALLRAALPACYELA